METVLGMYDLLDYLQWQVTEAHELRLKPSDTAETRTDKKRLIVERGT